MRGIIAAAGYVPHHRLERSAIGAFLNEGGGGAGRGTRAVAGYDEDSLTLAVEAARLAARGIEGGTGSVSSLWFATSTPTYAEKTNATTVHAALGLPVTASAFDLAGVRSGLAGFVQACGGSGQTLVTSGDVRTGQPGSGDERDHGDAGVALLVGDDSDGAPPVLAEFVTSVSLSEEFLDRWRVPGEARTRSWEERFGETRYTSLGFRALDAVLERLEVPTGEVDHLVICGQSPRAVAGVTKKTGASADPFVPVVGNTGTVHPLLRLVHALESAKPGDLIVVVHLADGADAVAVRATDALGEHRPYRPLAQQLQGSGGSVTYARFLSWRSMLSPEPPNRPEPARASAAVAGRRAGWKYGFVGSRERSGGALHLPPARVDFDGETVDEMDPAPMSEATGTVFTFTVDRLAYSPSPPVVFAVVDFEGGGRLPVELTDATPDEVEVGSRVEMTFRRLNSADGIANYFWKARLAPTAAAHPIESE